MNKISNGRGYMVIAKVYPQSRKLIFVAMDNTSLAVTFVLYKVFVIFYFLSYWSQSKGSLS